MLGQVAACSTYSCGMRDLPSSLWNVNSWLQHVGSSSLTRDRTQSPCTGSRVLAPGPQGSPERRRLEESQGRYEETQESRVSKRDQPHHMLLRE